MGRMPRHRVPGFQPGAAVQCAPDAVVVPSLSQSPPRARSVLRRRWQAIHSHWRQGQPECWVLCRYVNNQCPRRGLWSEVLGPRIWNLESGNRETRERNIQPENNRLDMVQCRRVQLQDFILGTYGERCVHRRGCCY